jgi:FAD:protein FMN transferase
MISRTWIEMGMPVTVCLRDEQASEADIEPVRELLAGVNRRFSPFLESSEVSALNAGLVRRDQISGDLKSVLRLCEQTRQETGGYFDIDRDGTIDPSGLVKGWAIQRASDLLFARGLRNYLVDAGGDVQAVGLGPHGRCWRVGIRNPFNRQEIVKVLAIANGAVATSGTAIRGSHIYNPRQSGPLETDLVSLTVVGASILDADRMATAAFAMGTAGVSFISEQDGLECYGIAADGVATFTSGFMDYCVDAT